MILFSLVTYKFCGGDKHLLTTGLFLCDAAVGLG